LKLWKVLGVAGIAGVAATGVVVARGERRRHAYGPDDVRARLRQRHAEAVEDEATPNVGPEAKELSARDKGRAPGCLGRPWAAARSRLLRRRDQ